MHTHAYTHLQPHTCTCTRIHARKHIAHFDRRSHSFLFRTFRQKYTAISLCYAMRTHALFFVLSLNSTTSGGSGKNRSLSISVGTSMHHSHSHPAHLHSHMHASGAAHPHAGTGVAAGSPQTLMGKPISRTGSAKHSVSSSARDSGHVIL